MGESRNEDSKVCRVRFVVDEERDSERGFGDDADALQVAVKEPLSPSVFKYLSSRTDPISVREVIQVSLNAGLVVSSTYAQITVQYDYIGGNIWDGRNR